MFFVYYVPSSGRAIFYNDAYNNYLQPLTKTGVLSVARFHTAKPAGFNNSTVTGYVYDASAKSLTATAIAAADASAVALLSAKCAALQALTEAIGNSRHLYAKTLVGQFFAYQLKQAEATQYQADVAAGSTIVPGNYPTLLASANASGLSLTQEAVAVLAQEAAYQGNLKHTEVARVTETAKIIAATDLTTVQGYTSAYTTDYVGKYPFPTVAKVAS
ncbi:hypothetical protein [Paraburkholderia sp. BCC1886]|uniref:hypothetical protein n=1 Tax=Paraburkholderia sp. BCC1886 TaxID=2562670 RepID=UPI0011826054|nr:hypothetical protein [Paraburkholderia sp. BCC1886]